MSRDLEVPSGKASGVPSLDLSPVRDLSPTNWLIDEITELDYTVRSFLPMRFVLCARVLHPAHLYVPDQEEQEPVTWAQVAAANGGVLHSQAQFSALAQPSGPRRQSPRWNEAPRLGVLPEHEAITLLQVLSRHTSAEQFWYGLWYGYGRVDAFDIEQYPRFHLPKRDYVLLSGGPLSGARSLTSPPRRVIPSLWWPEDQAWFVRLDPDLDSTYVGVTSSKCLGELTSTPGIEMIEARLSDCLDLASDHINGA
jgi:hypothetical protein